jgi:transcriptional regulator with XRE-family HTH domain
MGGRARLKARRRERGLSQEGLADALAVSLGAVKDWEQGRRSPQAETRPALADALGVTLAELALLLGEPPSPNGHAVPGWLGHLASLEQAAGQLWAFEPVVVHGLLQTRAYATAVERVGPSPMSDDHVAQKVETRIARQAVLTREPGPLQLRVVLDESVLYRVAGSSTVMADQLAHLAKVAELPNVEVRVLPLTAGVFSAAFGAFSVFASADSPEPFMVVTEDRSGPHYVDRATELEAHIQLHQFLRGAALDPAASIDLVHRTQERYR